MLKTIKSIVQRIGVRKKTKSPPVQEQEPLSADMNGDVLPVRIAYGYNGTTGTGTFTHYSSGVRFNTYTNWSSGDIVLSEVDVFFHRIVEKIDQNSMSDYEFREWLRDNLGSCSYNTENGATTYKRPVATQPISVLDAMMYTVNE